VRVNQAAGNNPGVKRHAPATERNRLPIADILERELPADGTVLEVASGSGEHAVFFASRFRQLLWQPSDSDPEALASIMEWRNESGADNLLAPLVLDAASADWRITAANAVLCVNMIHISPWVACEGLFAGANRLLESGAPLILYGPFLEESVETAQSNLAFNESLRRRDPDWGIRDLADVDGLAAQNAFTPATRYTMPANNLLLVYRHE